MAALPSPPSPIWRPSLLQTLQDTASAHQGWLSFDLFMAAALGHSSEGYYNRALAVTGQAGSDGSPLGPAGDFVTAPLLGPWLAQCLARRFQTLQAEAAGSHIERGHEASPQRASGPIDPPVALSIREYGPGTGQLAADLLMALESVDCLPERYELMETNPGLAAFQQSRLRDCLSAEAFGRLHWQTTEHGAAPFRGLVVANEVADALPMKVFEWQGPETAESAPQATPSEVLEWGLLPSDDGWVWASRPAEGALFERVRERASAVSSELGGWQRGHRGEWSPWWRPWAESLAAGLAWGEVLIIDYGYEAHELDHPDRAGGTLAAHRAHRRIDDWAEIVENPGGQDLTAHVDFSELASALEAMGCQDLRLKTQAAWLLDQGLLEIAQQRLFPTPEDAGRPPADLGRLRELANLQTLLSDAGMGQRFLVLSARRA